MCTGGFGRRSLSRPTDLVLLSSTIVRGAPCVQALHDAKALLRTVELLQTSPEGLQNTSLNPSFASA